MNIGLIVFYVSATVVLAFVAWILFVALKEAVEELGDGD